MQLRHDYWDDAAAREAFKNLVLRVHNLDFSEWESLGLWDEAFRPFTYFENGQAVASVCLYELDALIEGRPARLGQFSSVATRLDRRRQGLARELTELALRQAERLDGVYLFADAEAVPFYENAGFEARAEFIDTVELMPVERREGARPVDPAAELDLLLHHARRREPVSDRFAVLSEKLLAFHALYLLRDAVWEIPDLDCLLLARQREDRLEIYDVIAEKVPPFEAIHPYLAGPGQKTARFHFHADKMGVETVTEPLKENLLFVGAGFPLAKPVFPYASRA